MIEETVLPLSDPLSPFHVNVPLHDAKPVLELMSYFKLWKHFIAALVSYLKDLVMAKEFELNLNLQLVGSIQFPGFRDLPYKCLQSVEQQLLSPQTSQINTPKGEPSKALAPVSTSSSAVGESKRPGLAKTKSATSFLKNQTFAHKRTGSNPSLKLESLLASIYSGNGHNQKQSAAPHGHTLKQSATSHGHNGQYTGPTPINPVKFAPKSDVAVDPSFFPPKSLFTNMPQMLLNHHMNTYSAQVKLCREITNKLVPRLENLHKNLSLKIKEIRSLLKNESFANPTLIKEVSKTGAIMSTFVESVRRYLGSRPVLKHESDEDEEDAASMSDPFLIKLRLDYQLKNQLVHENFMFASYVNLQNISKDLLNYVIKELNGTTERLIRLVSAESVYASSIELAVYNLGVTLRDKLNNVNYEWGHFVAHNPNFLNVYETTPTSRKRETRGFKDVVVPFANSLHSKCLRCGYIYKKQKLLKSYTSFFYLLTCNYLHEFKVENTISSDGDSKTSPQSKKRSKGKVGGVVGPEDTPSKSYNLNDYSISTKSENDFKFVLTKISKPSHKFTFKCQNENDFKAWSSELFDLLKFSSNHLKRFKFIEDNLAIRERSNSTNSTLTNTSSGTGAGEPKKDMNLNLNNLLSHKMSLQKILSPSLSGIFTPKLQSPNECDSSGNKNPFETTFSDLVSQGNNTPSASPPAESPGGDSPIFESTRTSSRPMTPTTEDGASSQHQREHEDYLRLQNEILRQQQQLMELSISQSLNRPSLSRHSSTESMVSILEQTNLDLSLFLNKNRNLMENSGNHVRLDLESSLLIPKLIVLNHPEAS